MRLMSRAVVCAAAVALAAALPAPARAAVFIEPELGMRSLSEDAADLLDPGFEAGGSIGFIVVPKLALLAHVDVALHPPVREFEDAIEAGGSLALWAGARFYPLARDTSGPFQPYLGVGHGRGRVAWDYRDEVRPLVGLASDGIGSWMTVLEGGADLRVRRHVTAGVGGRWARHAWDDQTVEGARFAKARSHSLTWVGRVGFHF